MGSEQPLPLLQVQGVSKVYSGVKVLSGVNLDLYPGEVHALIGENGAGKSTLSKIISGVVQKTEGRMLRDGKEYNPSGTKDAVANGISIVHQEFNLIPVLNIAQNISLGKESSVASFIREQDSVKRAEDLMRRLHLDIPVRRKVRSLSVAQQQLVEIAKCLADDSRVIIMDEPTATLTLNETKKLFEIIDELRGNGVAILYISHKLEEVFAISQRITVLRDGNLIGTYATGDMNQDKLVTLMVGREISSMYEHENRSTDEPVLKVRNLSGAGLVKDVCFHLNRGEILGFGGLVGAGRTEVMKMLFGEMRFDSGEIEMFGEKIARPGVKDMVRRGLAYLPEDRKVEGILAGMDIRENMTLATLDKVSTRMFVNPGRERSASKGMVAKLSVKIHGLSQRVGSLSGGNQQKVVLGRWLLSDTRILILDEPTRGIDVGAKHEIYKLINQLCAQGVSIIMISSEMPELIGMCDRLLVMCEGRITGELRGDEITETAIMSAAMQRGHQL